jgi:hypothetical protein
MSDLLCLITELHILQLPNFVADLVTIGNPKDPLTTLYRVDFEASRLWDGVADLEPSPMAESRQTS